MPYVRDEFVTSLPLASDVDGFVRHVLEGHVDEEAGRLEALGMEVRDLMGELITLAVGEGDYGFEDVVGHCGCGGVRYDLYLDDE